MVRSLLRKLMGKHDTAGKPGRPSEAEPGRPGADKRRAGPPGGPGESGPGEPGYEGRVTLGAEGAAEDDEPIP